MGDILTKVDYEEVWKELSGNLIGVSLRLPICAGEKRLSQRGGGGSRVNSSNDGGLGVNDGEKTEGIAIDKNTAELADLVGRVANEADERPTQFSVNARGITVGQGGRTGGKCANGSDGTGRDSAGEVIEVPREGKVVGLSRRA